MIELGLRALVFLPTGVDVQYYPADEGWYAVGGAPAELVSMDGSTTRDLGFDADRLAVVDLDADAIPDLVGCAESGVVAWLADSSVVVLDERPCTTILAVDAAVVVDVDGLARIGIDGIAERIDAPVGAHPLIAGDAALYAADTGGTYVYRVDDWGTARIAAGGEVVGIAAGGGSAFVALADGRIRRIDGELAAIESAPDLLTAADVDRGGAWEAVAAVDSRAVMMHDDGRIVALEVGEPAWKLSSAQIGNCGDVLWLADTMVYDVQRLACVSAARDSDQDGWPSDVDCDDTDADVHPHAFELCDGLDQDCAGDGDAGAPRVRIVGPTTVDEGDAARFAAHVAACDSGEVVFDPIDGCEQEGDTLSCAFPTTGQRRIAAWIGERRTDTYVDVRNVPAQWDWNAPPFDRGTISVAPGQSLAIQLVADEPGGDLVTFALESDLAGVSLSPDGLFSAAGSDVAYAVDFAVIDADGARSRTTMTVEVLAPDDQFSCECCCEVVAPAGGPGSGVAPIALGFLAISRRYRRA